MYEHGEGGPTRAVCVDKGLDFTIGEMSSGDLGPLSNNRLFRGGEVRVAVPTFNMRTEVDVVQKVGHTHIHLRFQPCAHRKRNVV